jgi:hypothetical protein
MVAEIAVERGEDDNDAPADDAPAAIGQDVVVDGSGDALGSTGAAEVEAVVEAKVEVDVELEAKADAEADADPPPPQSAPDDADPPPPPPPARKKNVPPMVHRSAVRDRVATATSSTVPPYPTQEVASSSSAPDDDDAASGRRPTRIDTSLAGLAPTVHVVGAGAEPSSASAAAPAASDDGGIKKEGADDDDDDAEGGGGDAAHPSTDAKRRAGKGGVPAHPVVQPIIIPPGPPTDIDHMNRTWSETIFPMKLYDILCNPDFHYAISWMSHGRSWKVLNKDYFMEEICPRYFAQTRYESFVRQVNGWGFKRMRQEGSDRGSYYHEHFLRGYPNMIDHMRRPAPGEKSRDVREEPDFYAVPSMPPLPPGDANRMGRMMAAAIAYQNQVKKVGRPTGSTGVTRGGGSRGGIPPTPPGMTGHNLYGPPGTEGGGMVGPPPRGGSSGGGHHALPPMMPPPPMHGYPPPPGPGGYGPPPPQAAGGGGGGYYMPYPGGGHMAMNPYDGILSPGGGYGPPPPNLGYYPPMPNPYGPGPPGSPWRHPDTPSGGSGGGWPPPGTLHPQSKSPGGGGGGPPGALGLQLPPPGSYPPPLGYPYWDPQHAMPPPLTPGSRGSFRFSPDPTPASGTKRDREDEYDYGGGGEEKAGDQGRRPPKQFGPPHGAHPSMGPSTPGGGMWYPLMSDPGHAMMMQQHHHFAVGAGRAGPPPMSGRGGDGGDGDEDISEPPRYPGY